ncbi:MAG: tRNA (N(6)-L-threonylcarbamoyladenosine(37)-C(2))-methylthiotransferase [Candidatus Bathyarchaeota archaeon]|nr:MAG: tRNA (N(6)-L-threonylcarbamoyladenosine(37)-C(2))-methylthiotransferase [Candidatus Bathyarchaeota archaeon]
MTEKPKRVYVRSFGCPTNLADGEFMAGCLSEAGYEVVDRVEDADVVIYNTCGVKTPTENRVMNILRRVPRGKRLIVTGCLPLINVERIKDEVKFDGVLGPAPGSKIVEMVHKVGCGEKVVELEKNSKPSLGLPKISVNRVVGIVPINYGCLGSCSYCCVLFARGRLRSYRIEELVERVKRDLASGVKEVWLTSQDTACYGKDIATSLADLLKKVCRIEGEFFVRVGMMTPTYALEILNDLIQAYKDDKVFKFLHLPVQSGDDEVLKLMNRFYSVEDFRRIVNAFREEIPEITLATDVICGFPGESREAFEQTVELIKEVQPDVVNISKFFPRPHTPAGKMKPLVHPREVKERSRRLAELSKMVSLERNRAWMGWEGRILVDEVGKKPSSWMGRNFAYKPVVVKTGEFLLGKFLAVRVVEVFPTYLEAEIV